MTENGYTLSDIATVTGSRNDGMFGGGDWGAWIILFLIFGMFGRGGFGGFGAGGNDGGNCGYIGTKGAISEAFATNNIQAGITAIQQGICDSTYALNNAITNGFNGVQQTLCQGFNGVNTGMLTGFNGLQAQLADCCCENRAAIAQVRYDMATQACDTRHAIQDSTRQILDFLTTDKIATLQAENQNLKLKASQAEQNAFITANQQAQTAELIRRLGADCPVPAYVVQPPVQVSFPTNCCGQFSGYNGYGGCGCGCA